MLTYFHMTLKLGLYDLALCMTQLHATGNNHFKLMFVLFDLILYIPVTIFSVMSGRV